MKSICNLAGSLLVCIALFGATSSRAQDFAYYHKFFPKDVDLHRAIDINPPDKVTKLSEASGNFSGQLW